MLNQNSGNNQPYQLVGRSPVQTTPSSGSQCPVVSSPSFLDLTWEVANAVEVPQALVLNTTLAAMTVATQSLIDVETPLGQIKPVSNFFFGVSDSGNRKTTVDELLTGPIKAFDAERSRRHTELRLPEYKNAHEIWRTETTRLKRMATSTKGTLEEIQAAVDDLRLHLASEPIQPRDSQLVYSDVTSSALLEGLANKTRCAFVSNADASAILNGHTFRKLADLNILWDGGNLNVNRVSRESFRVTNSRLTIDIAVQLKPFNDFMQKSELARTTGFAARCLICVPESLMGSRFAQKGWSGKMSHLPVFKRRTVELLELASSLEDASGRIERKVVRFSEQAGKQWIDWINTSIEPCLGPGGYWSTVTDQASKMPEIVARIAAVISYFERGDMEINLSTFQLARDIGVRYLQNYRDVWDGKIEWIKRDQIKNTLEVWLRQYFRAINQNAQYANTPIFVSKNYLRNYGPNPVRSKKVLDESLGMLMNEGKIVVGPYCSVFGVRMPMVGGEQIIVAPSNPSFLA